MYQAACFGAGGVKHKELRRFGQASGVHGLGDQREAYCSHKTQTSALRLVFGNSWAKGGFCEEVTGLGRQDRFISFRLRRDCGCLSDLSFPQYASQGNKNPRQALETLVR